MNESYKILNTNLTHLEEFMIFQDNRGRVGVVLKSNHKSYNWQLYYGNNVGQLMNEGGRHHYGIDKLFRAKETESVSKEFLALSFIEDGREISKDDYELYFDRNKEEKFQRKLLNSHKADL